MEELPGVLQPKLKKLKKRSPASEARSTRRLLEWQQRRDLQRGLEQLTTPLPPSRKLKNVRLIDRLEGRKLGSQAPPFNQWCGSQASSSSPSVSGTQTSPSSPLSLAPLWSGSQASPSQSGSQTSPSSPLYLPPLWSGSQTFHTGPSQSGSQTSPSCPPWSGNQETVHQDYWLSASTFNNQTMLQQSYPPLVSLPSPVPGLTPPSSLPSFSPSTGWTRPAGGGSTWGTLPALVTTCPSCHAWGLLTSH